MKRNWKILKDILSYLYENQRQPLTTHSTIIENLPQWDENNIKYHLQLLKDIDAITIYQFQFSFVINITWLGIEIVNVLETMEEEEGIDLNSIDGTHPRIVKNITPLINRLKQKN